VTPLFNKRIKPCSASTKGDRFIRAWKRGYKQDVNGELFPLPEAMHEPLLSVVGGDEKA